jgi:methyl-accepting chemotaxis protein
MLKNLSFKKKILVSFAFNIFLFVCIIIFLFNTQSKLGQLQDEGATRFKDSDSISHVLQEVAEVYSVIADAQINHNLEETKKDLIEIKKQMEENVNLVKKVVDTDDEKKWAREFEENYHIYVGTFENEMLVELEKSSTLNAKTKELDEKLDGLRNETIKYLKLIDHSIGEESRQSDIEFDKTFRQGLKVSALAALLVSVLSIFISMLMANSISRELVEIKNELIRAFDQILENAHKVSTAAQNLSESTSEQASAIQQTSSSIEEMSSMIKKTSDSASDSTQLSRSSAQNAVKGKMTADNLVNSVNEIEVNNKVIMTEVESGNRKIGEIVVLINEIGAKTKVINDIVFQTKLLSFNASVEAARAGEQGKGFSVVAEEIGNLAQMSGKAATEISAMLDDSTLKVKSVIEETQRSVSTILAKGNQVVRQGVEVAEETSHILEVIDRDVKSMSVNIKEISEATDEQAKGAEQVTQAVHQLDSVTQMNSALSQQLFSYSKDLSAQTEKLNNAMLSLAKIVEGQAKN